MFPHLWVVYAAHLELQRQRRELLQSYAQRYPSEVQWFKEMQDWGFYQWSPRQRVTRERGNKLIGASRWVNENPDKLHEVVRRVNHRGRPPLLSIPDTTVVLQKKPQPCKIPSGYPYSTPSFSPLIAALQKQIDMTEINFVATSMSLRTIGLAKPSKKPAVFVQRYRHMLVLNWSGSFILDLNQPGFQLERALTGSLVDAPYHSLGSTHTIRTGAIGAHKVLCCGEVDAMDRDGNVVEIKSDPKASKSADGKVQLMLCGAGKKVSPRVRRDSRDEIVISEFEVQDVPKTAKEEEEGEEIGEDCPLVSTDEGNEFQSMDFTTDASAQTPAETGVMALGWRVKFVLDWLLEQPELRSPRAEAGADGAAASLLSRTYSISFDNIGMPSLAPHTQDLLPHQAACDELFGYSPRTPRPGGARKGRWTITRRSAGDRDSA
uniref:Uncharacterized protein n=1 Tax=Pyramimonas obovata TaxID=1411642 RepID=A0A7S0RE17_9CHLO